MMELIYLLAAGISFNGVLILYEFSGRNISPGKESIARGVLVLGRAVVNYHGPPSGLTAPLYLMTCQS